MVERLDDHPLYRRMLDLDPELLLPLVVDRFGSTPAGGARRCVADQLVAGQQDGSIRALDTGVAATAVLLAAQSFVFSARFVDEAELAYASCGGCSTGTCDVSRRLPQRRPSGAASSTSWPVPQLDVLVVGGGVTGCGIALDAAQPRPDGGPRREGRPRLRHQPVEQQDGPRRAAVPRQRRRRHRAGVGPRARHPHDADRAAPGPGRCRWSSRSSRDVSRARRAAGGGRAPRRRRAAASSPHTPRRRCPVRGGSVSPRPPGCCPACGGTACAAPRSTGTVTSRTTPASSSRSPAPQPRYGARILTRVRYDDGRLTDA